MKWQVHLLRVQKCKGVLFFIVHFEIIGEFYLKYREIFQFIPILELRLLKMESELYSPKSLEENYKKIFTLILYTLNRNSYFI